VDPILTVLSFALFAFIVLFVHKFLYLRVSNLGSEYTLESMKSNNLIEQTLTSFREIAVKNQQNYYLFQFSKVRQSVSNMDASLRFMPNISKYVIEIAIILSAILFSAYQFIRFDASVAIGTLSLFLAALMRIGPAFMRIQQSVLSLKNALATSQESLNLISEIDNSGSFKKSLGRNLTSTQENNCKRQFSAKVIVENLTYSYEKNRDILKNLTFTFADREITAIVGVSGSGKSTLMDLMLGVLELQNGTITISNEKPKDAIKKWPGKITYVPQETKIYDGTIRDNILLGMSADSVTDFEISEVINLVQLSHFIENQNLGIYSEVGERGTSLSGGQKQRIGLARGLITKPELVFLDEATSALDGQTEFQLTEEIKSLKKNTTVIMIAHRLATVRIADKVLYLTTDGNIGFFGPTKEFFQKLDNNEFENFVMN
jgi:ABC-type multidrug transport system fused ATPase/permease subunit